MNNVNLYGNLGQDPQLKESEYGPVCVLNVATHEHYQKDGKPQKRTDWHRVVVFGPSATACGEHLNSGSAVLVEGKLRKRSYEQAGEKKFIVEVIAKRVQFVGGKAVAESPVLPELESEEAVWDGIPF